MKAAAMQRTTMAMAMKRSRRRQCHLPAILLLWLLLCVTAEDATAEDTTTSSAEETTESATADEQDDRQLILNGNTVTDPSAFPWFVFNRLGRGRGCGGTLIHKDIVLSAAHCYVVFDGRGVYIGGTTDYGFDGTFHEDEVATTHPSFDGDTLRHDLLLVHLEQPSLVTPVPLNFGDETGESITEIPAEGDTVTIVGFGATRENGGLSATLQETTVTVTNQRQCRFYYEDFETPISNTQVCAYDNDPDATNATRQDSCDNDSGGPMLRQRQNGDGWEQVGIVSFSQGCGRPDVPAVYVRVSAYKDWITTGICELSSFPPEYCSQTATGGTPSAGQVSGPGTAPASSPTGNNNDAPSVSLGGLNFGGANGGDNNGANLVPTPAPMEDFRLTIFPADPALSGATMKTTTALSLLWGTVAVFAWLLY